MLQQFNPLRAKLFGENKDMYLPIIYHYDITTPVEITHVIDSNASSRKTMANLSCIVNIMTTNGAKSRGINLRGIEYVGCSYRRVTCV